MSETEVEKEKKKISLLAKIIDGSRKRDPFEKRHWYENEYRLWPSTDSHLCQRAPFNLSTRRNGVPPPPGGFGGWRCRKRGGEERRRRKRERKKEGKKKKEERKKERDPCGIGRVEYVKRITRSSRTESPDQLHNGATETDALQPPPRAPLALSRPKASPLSLSLLPLPPRLLAQPLSQSDYRTKGWASSLRAQ